ncbi:uncharacterized protein PHACADRAFT_214459 [Phanerochaete carnosa HHB-10118-sp]|uniref:Cullin family profile domain-containing protein n=1 Tax=Phanerochaete carnosa (strain HHB-10118-sp) TaxID=650164 RepID=K5VR57_PHACS|nr:uncharacterized protein PHACADRAFT_214459 [Phanerochaete carnosa HHB-10118-sp]EKM49220.1 hypothetical protein PHACADRAFT_214459 [Phanerochaete carnosa HHB-10118-sp]
MPALKKLMPGPDIVYLQHMYRLYVKIGCLSVLAAALRLYVKDFVYGIFTDGRPDDQRVAALFTQRKAYFAVLDNAFYDEVPILPSIFVASSGPSPETRVIECVPNRELASAILDGIGEGLKASPDKFAELLANYLHKTLLRGPKGRDVADYHTDLEVVLSLYCFTNSKDVFRIYYHRTLAKRLLLESSASLEYERFVLAKLKEDYDPMLGVGNGMLADIAHSKELSLEFKEKRLGHPTLSIFVLKHTNWPFALHKTKVVLPVWMSIELTKYKRFHKDKYENQVIEWDHALGYATLIGNFDLGSKELSVDLLQAVVLLLFNDTEEIPFQGIATRTKIEQPELRRILQSLACGKKRILRKRPAGNEVNGYDIFSFNAKFSDPESRIHINPVPVTVKTEEADQAEEGVHTEHKYALRAAIIRVMKAKRKLSREQLGAAVAEAGISKFFPPPSVALMDECIEGLVRDDYLGRAADAESNMLHYNPY